MKKLLDAFVARFYDANVWRDTIQLMRAQYVTLTSASGDEWTLLSLSASSFARTTMETHSLRTEFEFVETTGRSIDRASHILPFRGVASYKLVCLEEHGLQLSEN